MADLECADLSALCQAATCGGHGTLSWLDGDSGDKRVPRAAAALWCSCRRTL